MRTRTFGLWGAALVCLALGVGFAFQRTGERRAPPRPTFVVIGADGAAWRVIERLWAEGGLPHLKALADRGSRATLRTAYNASPVIWTTIATGVVPERHGITDFVVPTARGDVPVASTVRRAPALWNMLSRAGRRVAVLGWWASWPAEEVEGVVLSDRVMMGLDRAVFPPEYAAQLRQDLAAADLRPSSFRSRPNPERRDRLMAHTAERLVSEDYDLVLLYIRSTDVISHKFWKYFEPDRFAPLDPAELARHRDEVPRIYRALDETVGRLVAQGPDSNFVVLSDHGFHAADEDDLQIVIDVDAVLAELGYLAKGPGGVDFARSRLYGYNSQPHHLDKEVRFALAGREPGGTVAAAERPALRARLEADLARIRYASGAPAFAVRDARPREIKGGADFVIKVLRPGAGRRLLRDGQPLAATAQVLEISGTHTASTHGIWIAAGPQIQAGAALDGIHIHDVAPTLLYGLGLPVADDFAGRAWQELYTAEFRARHPVRRIRTWGPRAGGEAEATAADQELLEELRALGYLN
ncbi:MAG TPA: alkaline phosphatase family protein [Thermoanaerobaculia bacterium]|nr:alkaline phosphatase family protein [Thermoanaerobaculia bacterium]